MTKRPKMLSATLVKTINVPGRYGDGRGGLGLSLLVRPASRGGFAKCWTQSVRIEGRPTSIGLGRYPVVTLAMARARALENARAIAEGRDPRRAANGVPTFAKASETVISIHAENWRGARSEEAWRTSLRDYVLPRLGDRPVNAITTADVMAVLLPIWSSKRETARRVRQRIGAVMKWAVAQGYRADNPTSDAISAALPRNGVRIEHHKALPHAEVAAALRQVARSGAYGGTVLAFEFLVLTACRSGEVRHARWAEIDLEDAVWTIPGERMKAGREHRVPLSARARGARRRAATHRPRRHRVPVADRPGAQPVVAGEAPAGTADRRRAARLPVQLPRLGRRVHRGSARGLRTGPGARQPRPRRGRVPAQRPVRTP